MSRVGGVLLDAVVGVKGTAENIGGKVTLTHVGITCALCHSIAQRHQAISHGAAEGLQHAPYFHNGRAPTLDAVVRIYDTRKALGLTQQQMADLVQYLASL